MWQYRIIVKIMPLSEKEKLKKKRKSKSQEKELMKSSKSLVKHWIDILGKV